jgi:hypothetical protein
MESWQVTSKATGEPVFRYQCDDGIGPIYWVGMEAETHDHTLVVEETPETPPVTVYGGRRLLSRLEFLRLFTVTERITMRTAAKQSPVMEDYLQLLDLALEISLDDPDTVAGVQMMEGAGLLATGRAAEVLRG